MKISNQYSIEFQELIADQLRVSELLANCSFTGSFNAWEERKTFISRAIHKDGSILDIGCGNGFLLRCLQEWSRYQLIPYGIDINEIFIQKAKELFPECTKNFAVVDAKKIDQLASFGLTGKYDFVYYSNRRWRGDLSKWRPTIQQLLDRLKPNGRLILGFYDELGEENMKSLQSLVDYGIKFTEVIKNPTGTNLVAWMSQLD